MLGSAYRSFVRFMSTQEGQLMPYHVAALGLCGEAAEASLTPDTDTLKLELGDVVFYVAAFCEARGISDTALEAEQTMPHLDLPTFCGSVADRVKKEVWHRRPTSAGEYVEDLHAILQVIDWAAKGFGSSLRGVIDANTEKLKERWPDGFVPG